MLEYEKKYEKTIEKARLIGIYKLVITMIFMVYKGCDAKLFLKESKKMLLLKHNAQIMLF
jgi:hypothetical protein